MHRACCVRSGSTSHRMGTPGQHAPLFSCSHLQMPISGMASRAAFARRTPDGMEGRNGRGASMGKDLSWAAVELPTPPRHSQSGQRARLAWLEAVRKFPSSPCTVRLLASQARSPGAPNLACELRSIDVAPTLCAAYVALAARTQARGCAPCHVISGPPPDTKSRARPPDRVECSEARVFARRASTTLCTPRPAADLPQEGVSDPCDPAHPDAIRPRRSRCLGTATSEASSRSLRPHQRPNQLPRPPTHHRLSHPEPRQPTSHRPSCRRRRPWIFHPRPSPLSGRGHR